MTAQRAVQPREAVEEESVTTMQKHFVTFYSPGTLFPEETTQPIESWDVREAFERSRAITERHDARPYCFMFSTRERGDDDLDSKEVASSPRYFMLGDSGKIETRAEVEARNDPKEEILRSNMRCNDIERVITTNTPWRNTTALRDDDVVLDANGRPVP